MMGSTLSKLNQGTYIGSGETKFNVFKGRSKSTINSGAIIKQHPLQEEDQYQDEPPNSGGIFGNRRRTMPTA
jgi:hypothetical protein